MVRHLLDRRRLLGLLGLAPAAASVAAIAAPRAGSAGSAVKLLFTRVNGELYYDAHLSLPTLNVGDPVALRREPGNAHDRRAIEVFDAAGRKLGYVSRADNSAVARMMDAGERFVAEVARLDRERSDIRLNLFWLRPERF